MNDDLIARAEALMPMLDGCHDYANIQAAEMVPELVAEVKRLTQLIDHTASNFLQLQPGIAWDGGIDEAMKAAVDEIRSCREQLAANDAEIKWLRADNARAERAHESLDAMRRRQLAAKDAEICILKTEVCAAQKNIKRRDDDIEGLTRELTRWREIAIEERAKLIHFFGENDIVPSDSDRKLAAKELSIQISQDDDDLTTAYMLGGQKANERLKVLQEYVNRLEADYLSWVQVYYSDLGEEVAMQRARDVLEKIRHAD